MKPIYVNAIHEVIIESYLDTIYDCINEVVKEQEKIKDFQEIADIIIDYHNQYNSGMDAGNWNDFLMIIPINFSTMVSGFLCGYQNSTNLSTVRLYKHLISNFGLKAIEDLQQITPINE